MMCGIRFLATAIAVAVLSALWILGPVVVRAQDDGIIQTREIAGPYDIEVLTAQSRLSLGLAIFFVIVVDAVTGQPVPDARVTLRTQHEGSDTGGWATAHNTPSSPDRYEAQVNLNEPGTWHVRAEVTSSLGLESIEIAPLIVPEGRQFSSGTIVFAGVFAVLIAGAAYLIWSNRRKPTRGAGPGAAGQDPSHGADVGSGSV